MSGARGVVRSLRFRPRYRRGPWRVAGPDEDAFTLAVHAAQRLTASSTDGGAPPPRRIHLVGDVLGITEESLVAALGDETIEVRRHHGSPDGALAALESSVRSREPDEVDLVVGVDTPTSDESAAGSAAVGLCVGSGPGIEIGRHLRITGANGRAPSPSSVLARAAPFVGEGRTRLDAIWMEFSDAPAAGWAELWASRAVDGGWDASGPAPDLGWAPATGLLALLHRAREGWTAGARGLVGVAEPAVVTLLELRSTGSGPPRGTPPNSEDTTLLPLPESAGHPLPRLEAVSEGAYVPKPTYVESLASRWRLVGSTCSACGAVTFPPRRRCRQCGRDDQLRSIALPRRALAVAAVTTIAPGAQPTEFDPQVGRLGAFSVVLVDVVPGVRVTAQVTDAKAGSLAIGERIDLELRRLYPMEGEWRYGLKAVPSRGPTPSA